MKQVIINQDSLAHHLRIVADHYEVNAASCQDAGHGRLADEFRRQQAECAQWAQALDEATRLSIDGDHLVVEQ